MFLTTNQERSGGTANHCERVVVSVTQHPRRRTIVQLWIQAHEPGLSGRGAVISRDHLCDYERFPKAHNRVWLWISLSNHPLPNRTCFADAGYVCDEFRSQDFDELRNYFLGPVSHRDLVSS